MKQLQILFYSLLLNLCLLQAQQSDVMAEYEMVLQFSGNVLYTGKLLFNSGRSLFLFRPAATQDHYTEEDQGNNKATMRILDTTDAYISINRSENILLEKKKSLYTKEVLLVKEEVPRQAWVLEEEQKIIGRFSCKKAVAFFRGRRYIAWYCPDLPYSFGPWKLNGLPGLIVETRDEEGEVSFSLKQIVSPFHAPLMPQHQDPLKIIAYPDYRKKIQQEELAFQQRILSRFSREMNATVSVKRDDIERE
ncbi:MAG TPA: GLPGLI family protein [Sediminibacterium sp.]|nr:GLPGLI family protein [Sediminibacterium sp.]